MGKEQTSREAQSKDKPFIDSIKELTYFAPGWESSRLGKGHNMVFAECVYLEYIFKYNK